MSRLLPIILIVIGILVFVGAYFVMKKDKVAPDDSTVTLIDIPLNERPFVSLTPSADGHWVKLRIEKPKALGSAKTLEYELVYKVPEHPDQGTNQSIELKDNNTIERDILFGSESSGKKRYDEGVSEGGLVLKYRNSSGKLLAKLSTDFHLQSTNSLAITSVDGAFKYSGYKKPTKPGYIVAMNTLRVESGLPKDVKVASGPFTMFASIGASLPDGGTVEGFEKYYVYRDGKWNKAQSTEPASGSFVSVSN